GACHWLRTVVQADGCYRTKHAAGFTACAPLHVDYGQLLGFLLTGRFGYSLSHLSLLKITRPNNTTRLRRGRTQVHQLGDSSCLRDFAVKPALNPPQRREETKLD